MIPDISTATRLQAPVEGLVQHGGGAGACACVSSMPGDTVHLLCGCRSYAAGRLLCGQVSQGGAAGLGLGQAQRGGGVAGGGDGGPKAVPRGAGVHCCLASSPLQGKEIVSSQVLPGDWERVSPCARRWAASSQLQQ